MSPTLRVHVVAAPARLRALALSATLAIGCGHAYLVDERVAAQVAKWPGPWRADCAVAAAREDGERVWVRANSLDWADARSDGAGRTRVPGERRVALSLGGALLAGLGITGMAIGIDMIAGASPGDDQGLFLLGAFPLAFGLGHAIAGIPMIAAGAVPHAGEVSIAGPADGELAPLPGRPADACSTDTSKRPVVPGATMDGGAGETPARPTAPSDTPGRPAVPGGTLDGAPVPGW